MDDLRYWWDWIINTYWCWVMTFDRLQLTVNHRQWKLFHTQIRPQFSVSTLALFCPCLTYANHCLPHFLLFSCSYRVISSRRHCFSILFILIFSISYYLQCSTPLCLSMSDFHPESWNPLVRNSLIPNVPYCISEIYFVFFAFIFVL